MLGVRSGVRAERAPDAEGETLVSLHEYRQSREIDRHGWPFYALIMSAMRQADADNGALLRTAFPGAWTELAARYQAPGGVLPEERTGE